MKIDSCDFPEDIVYEPEGLVWLRREVSGEVVLGATSILAALAGPLTSVNVKPPGAFLDPGKAFATVESGRYFGPLRSPVSGEIIAVNSTLVSNPRRLSISPYADGWVVRLRPSNWDAERAGLRSLAAAREGLARQMAALHIHCFAAFPDHEMVEIGTECAAVMTKLDELLARIPSGEVVHVVSDDWTAPAEMENWSQRTRHPLLETRKEGQLYHFLVRKA